MTVQTNVSGDVAVLTVTGPVLSGPDVQPLADRVDRLLLSGIRELVIDLEGVRWSGAALMGGLIRIRERVLQAGAVMCLAGRSRSLDRVLTRSGLNRYFQRAWCPNGGSMETPFPFLAALGGPLRF